MRERERVKKKLIEGGKEGRSSSYRNRLECKRNTQKKRIQGTEQVCPTRPMEKRIKRFATLLTRVKHHDRAAIALYIT